MLIADTLRQVANIIFAAGVVGRMFGSERGSLVIPALGMAARWVILDAAVEARNVTYAELGYVLIVSGVTLPAAILGLLIWWTDRKHTKSKNSL